MKAEVARMQAETVERKMEEREGIAKREALAEVLEIDDAKVLDKLVDLEMCGSSVVAFSLVPMVAVAWADWEIQKKEREAIMKAASEHGIVGDCLASKVLERWLNSKPSSELYRAWKEYAHVLAEGLDEQSLAKIKDATIGRARAVAESAGGFLGLGSKISADEQAVLDDLEEAFS